MDSFDGDLWEECLLMVMDVGNLCCVAESMVGQWMIV